MRISAQTRAGIRRVAIMSAACWVLFPLDVLSLAILILVPLALLHAIRNRSVVAMLIAILANPLSFFFMRGIADYAGGRPALRGMGLPGPEHSNIDPETRCLRSSGGCLVRGNDWVTIMPHNTALRTMTFLFGSPADTYDGPYPTRAAAAAASKAGVLVSPEEFRSGAIPTNAGVIRLDPANTQKMGMSLLPMSACAWAEEVEGEELHATLWQKRCLILRWRAIHTREEADEVIVLIDVRNGRPFAVYRIAGDPHLRRAAISGFWR